MSENTAVRGVAPRADRDDPQGDRRGPHRPDVGALRRDREHHDRLDRTAHDHRRPRGDPDAVHLGRHRLAARHDRDQPHLEPSSPTSSTRRSSSRSRSCVFLLGSLAAGAVQNVPELLAARAVQGLGMGGLIALAQSIIGSIIPPRERGRYSGYMAAMMAVATVSGPLLGGLLVDSAGWRWCFWVAIPFAARRPGDAAEVPAHREHPPRGPHRLLGRAVHHRSPPACRWSGSPSPAPASPGGPCRPRSSSALPSSPWSRPSSSNAGTATRSCRPASWPTGSRCSRSSGASRSVSPSSVRRSSWRSTSRSPATTPRPRPVC